jgi:sulfur-oxidizing protein SoxY
MAGRRSNRQAADRPRAGECQQRADLTNRQFAAAPDRTIDPVQHQPIQRRLPMIDAKRRILLKGSLGAGAVGVAVSAGLLTPATVLGAWPEAAFKAEDQATALKDLLGSDTTEASDKVKIKAPDIAENGAVVPVTVESDVPHAKTISIIASGNNTPLIASFELSEQAKPFVSTRIKMAKTADVVAVVQTEDGLLSAAKAVKVTIGGCGG